MQAMEAEQMAKEAIRLPSMTMDKLRSSLHKESGLLLTR